jgi:hypothetical protein
MKTDSSTNTTSALAQRKEKLLAKRESMMANFQKAASVGDQKKLARSYDQIRQTNDFLSALEQIESESMPNADGPRQYAVSSLFLHESFKKLTADANEQFFFVTGTEINQTMVLDQWIDLVHERRSMVGVTTDPKVSHRLLIKLEQFGHKLLAHFHSHPGTGYESTRPSGTDVSFQQRLEGAGHVALMVIFSRDGFVRFLRLDDNVEVKIYGEGVEAHGRNIYRLSRID